MMKQKKINAIWITWEIQPRNRSMSKLLGVHLYELTINANRFIKYPILLFRTLSLILKENPKLIFVQNPSIVLAFFIILIKMLSKKDVIVDAHNAGIFPLEGKSKFLSFIVRIITRKANATIVSNKYLANIVNNWHGKSFVMPDPLPKIGIKEIPATAKDAHKNKYILFICTWASDEPYREVIEAAKLLRNIDIYITGNFNKKISSDEQKKLPQSVKLLGFVSEEEYIEYFSNAIAAIDLTTRDNCLVCGAYEAAALGVPAILSDSQINREVFTDGYLYTKNNAHNIAIAIETIINNREALQEDLIFFKSKHEKEIELNADLFKSTYMQQL